ncbi:MAG: transketolase [Alphaproteobacteria bacterium]|nr:transketolase [Alphaproteobacteria bacterium]
MLRIRLIEQAVQHMSEEKPPAFMGSTHLCAGQEAVPVGAVAGLRDDDQVISTYRGHGWAIEAGVTPDEVLGEILHRATGINQGRAGSAYMMAPERRFIGENSIVGAGVPVACGIAMANLAAKNDRVVVVSIGDGAMNQGATNEAMAFAAARQLPVIIICENNGWSEMTATLAINKVERLARRAAGFGIASATIDGSDPVAVRDSIRLAADRARQGEGPSLIECTVPRLWGHYNRDIEHYRPKEDRADAEARDPITRTRTRLRDDLAVSSADLDALTNEVAAEVAAVVARARTAPLVPEDTAHAHVVAKPVAATPPVSDAGETREMVYINAVNAALDRALKERPEVVVYGEDVGFAGGIFGATRNLQKTYGAERVFDTPIAESAILGSAVGAAMAGLRPVVEIMWADFMLVALDQLINQAANVRYITGGKTSVPLTVRTQQGATPGSCAQHSQCLEALLAHIPGLKVALAATPQDAYDLLRSAIADPDPCIVFESRLLYQDKAPVLLRDAVEPVGLSKTHRTGSDALIVTWGAMVPVALEAADQLRGQGKEVGVLDLRWLTPMDDAALVDMARAAGGRVVVAHEANMTGGFGGEVSARISEALGAEGLHTTVRRVATPDARIPAAPHLLATLRPDAHRIAAAVDAVCSPALTPA